MNKDSQPPSNPPAGQETENTRWVCEKEIHDLLDQITVTHHAEYGFIVTLPRESGNQFLVKLTDVARQAMRAEKAERELSAAKAQLNIASGIIHGLTVKLDTATAQLATAREDMKEEWMDRALKAEKELKVERVFTASYHKVRAELEAQALRYQWLREKSSGEGLWKKKHAGQIQVIQWADMTDANALTHSELDAAVDEAIRALKTSAVKEKNVGAE